MSTEYTKRKMWAAIIYGIVIAFTSYYSLDIPIQFDTIFLGLGAVAGLGGIVWGVPNHKKRS